MGAQVDRYSFRNQHTGKAVDLHLECSVGSILAARNNGAVKAPVAQRHAVYGNSIGIGCPARRTADGNMLAGDQSAGVEEELRERIVHPVDGEYLAAGEIYLRNLAQLHAGAGGQQPAHIEVEAGGCAGWRSYISYLAACVEA